MTDYQWGLLVGAAVGYMASLSTMVLVWALCVVARDERSEQNDYERMGRGNSGREE